MARSEREKREDAYLPSGHEGRGGCLAMEEFSGEGGGGHLGKGKGRSQFQPYHAPPHGAIYR
jgi:hypothetical protein